MHTMDTQNSNVPAFIVKLWKLVEDQTYDDLICWNNNGRSFIIHNQSRFAKELLPLYFKHNNMASFIRQLNMYGFRKVTNIENSGLRSDNDDIEFFHPYFAKAQESLLENIKRKQTSLKTSLQVSTGKNSLIIGSMKHEDVVDILSDVENIRGKQESVDNQIANMRKENEALWKEVAILRHKHHKQQQVVEKLIQFLVSLVHNRGVVGMKRKAQLMIDSADIGSNKSMKRDEFDFGASSNSKGPIIHDITDISEEEVNLMCNSPIITTSTLPNEMSPNPDLLTDNSQINDNLLPNSNQTIEPLSLLDPLQATIQELGLVADVDDTNVSEDINASELSVNNLLESSLSTPPGTPSTSFFDNNTNGTKNETKDLVISSSNVSDPSSTISLNEHVDGIEEELDSLQKLLSEGGLNIDTATLYGVCLEDLSFTSKLFSFDDPMISTNMPMTSNDIIGNEVVQFNPVNTNTANLLFDDFDLDTIVEENAEDVVVADGRQDEENDLTPDLSKDESEKPV